MKPVRVAVIGVGHIGRHHARLLQASDQAELVGVFDANEKTAAKVAETVGTKVWPDWTSMLDEVDAVSIAAPTAHHAAIAAPFLQRGIATLVEKPLAYSVQEGQRLVKLAEENNAVFQVGHVERFNPVWQDALPAMQQPKHIHAQRMGPYPFRSLDVSVVFDLMVHDVDLALAAINSEPVAVRATGASVVSPSLDRVDAQVDFANGSRAIFSTSRVHFEPVRQFTAWNGNSIHQIDLMNRKWTQSRRNLNDDQIKSVLAHLPPTLTPDEKNKRLEQFFGVKTHQADKTVEPLGAELNHFIECAAKHQTPLVDGVAGQQAIELVNLIEQAAKSEPGVPMPIRRAA